MEIVNLNPTNKQQAVNILCLAFYSYPEFIHYFPDPKKRTHLLPWYLEKVMNTAMHYGEVYTTPETSGVSFILPPGHTRISQWEYIRCGFLPAPLVLGLRDFVRSQMGEDFIGKKHDEVMGVRPHYYLWGLAVDPALKRKGIGSALLQPILARADAEKMPIYLETHDEKNVAYYQKTGFQLVKTADLPNSSVSVYCMVREPIQIAPARQETLKTNSRGNNSQLLFED
jgi:ribosomal protein S18 acetylase RimI-like enzyme